MNEHNFTADAYGMNEYQRSIYCTKCGKVAWFYNGTAEWNMRNTQNNIGECLSTNKE